MELIVCDSEGTEVHAFDNFTIGIMENDENPMLADTVNLMFSENDRVPRKRYVYKIAVDQIEDFISMLRQATGKKSVHVASATDLKDIKEAQRAASQ